MQYVEAVWNTAALVIIMQTSDQQASAKVQQLHSMTVY
jgi:hypothetical protein